MRIKFAMILALCFVLAAVPLGASCFAESTTPPFIEIFDCSYSSFHETDNTVIPLFDCSIATDLSEWIAYLTYTDNNRKQITKEISYSSNQEGISTLSINAESGEYVALNGHSLKHYSPELKRQYTLYFTDAKGTFRSELVSYMYDYKEPFDIHLSFVYKSGNLLIIPGHVSSDLRLVLYETDNSGWEQVRASKEQLAELPYGNANGFLLRPNQGTHTYYLIEDWPEKSNDPATDRYTFTIPPHAGWR